MVNHPKRKLCPKWEIPLSSNCTETPILSLRVKAELRKQRQAQAAEAKKLLEAS